MSLDQAIADLPPEQRTVLINLYNDCEECLLADGAAPEEITYRFLRSQIVLQAINGAGERHAFTIFFSKQPPYDITCRVHCVKGPADFRVTSWN